METLEHGNLILALEAANWRVAGENGAAQGLGMNASTLTSRMKASESSGQGDPDLFCVDQRG